MRQGHHQPVGDSAATRFFCHFSLWFGLLFASPVFVAAHNREDIVFRVTDFAGWAFAVAIVVALATWKLADRFARPIPWWTARVMLAAAIVFAIQGNVVHDMFEYGAFNGERVDYSRLGWIYWAEWLAWLAAFVMTTALLSRMQKLWSWLPLLPIASFGLMLTPLVTDSAPAQDTPTDAAVDPAVFTFSRIGNLVHLLPDGLQGDVVRQVFEENEDLAEAFKGFTLFADHVGTNQGTVPSMYTMLTGKLFDLEGGFDYQSVIPDLEQNSYQRRLLEHGYRLDYVPISGFICLDAADSCVVRPFNDMKARGFYRHRAEDIQYSVRLLADLSLFRLVPMYLKEKVYNDGMWFIADTTLDGSSPFPDPVIREWAEQMHVTDERPVFKWYHSIGTHIPAKWDAECRLRGRPSKERAAYVEQAECILRGISGLLAALEEKGIYDQTAMMISGDHGHNVGSRDATGTRFNSALTEGLHGTGRPALLVKQKNDREPLRVSHSPTSILDIMPTALELAGAEAMEPSVFDLPKLANRERLYRVYSISTFYSGGTVPYVEYSVGRPSADRGKWVISDIYSNRDIPTAYDPLNRKTGRDFVFGARLRKSFGNNRSSWVTGRQLAFVVGIPENKRPVELELSMHIPEWIGYQSFTARVDGGPPWRSATLKASDNYWETVRVPLPESPARPGRYFVSLVFDRLVESPDADDPPAAALIQSIRTVPVDAAAQAADLAHQ